MNIKVTKLNNKYHARLYRDDILISEYACNSKLDIGYMCREMLTWQDKLGNGNAWTMSARIRHNKDNSPVDKIWRII